MLRMKARGAAWALGTWLAICAAACSGTTDGPARDDDAPSGDGDTDIPPSADGNDPPVPNVLALAPSDATRATAEKYVELCSACHGDWGEGSSAPSLWKLDIDRDALVARIDTSMPPKDPALCSGACAEQMADYILERFGKEALSCQGITPAPRQLRLLNRREYTNTVRTLFGLADGAAPEQCGNYTFRYAPGREVTSVSVAGTFNDWSQTAWPMTYSDSEGAWLLTRQLPVGEHEFKYVVQSGAGIEWVPDPALPASAEFGNSLLGIECATGAGGALDLSMLPAETRPMAFAFDTSVTSFVGTPQFEAYLGAAKAVAAHLDDPGALSVCNLGQDRAACGRSFLTTFAKRAFRRPVSEEELTRYLALLSSIDDPDDALRATVIALLLSPNFLYRSELGEKQADGSFLLTPHEVASALSYLLLADMPDAALLEAADAGGLRTTEDVRAQAERLLEQSVSRGALSNFVLQWLGVVGVPGLERDASEFSPELSRDMLTETRSFAEHVLFDSQGTIAELLTANYTFANARLAALYGLPGSFGEEFTRAEYGDDGRAGVLGHASVLATFAHANQTSPVLRGLFVRRQLMCQRFGEPPPNAAAVPEPDPSLSTRERFAVHSQGSCASCHQYIDGLGFAFEGFDLIGKARQMDGTHPVDSAGEITGLGRLNDGSKATFDSPRALAALLVDSAAAHDCVAKQSFRFMRGAMDDGLSYCAVKFVRQRYRKSGGKVLEALLAAIESVDFRYRY